MKLPKELFITLLLEHYTYTTQSPESFYNNYIAWIGSYDSISFHPYHKFITSVIIPAEKQYQIDLIQEAIDL